MPKSKLKKIAEDMRRHVDSVIEPRHAWEKYELSRGLELLLQRVDHDRYRLAVRRENVVPSEHELEIVATVFGVPAGSDWQYRERAETHPFTHHTTRYMIAEVFWTEMDERAEAPRSSRGTTFLAPAGIAPTISAGTPT